MRTVTDADIARYEPWVKKVAAHYAFTAEDREDFEQELRLGVFVGFQRFDPAKGFQESTFVMATAWGHLKKHFYRGNTSMIRLPAWRRESGEKAPEVWSTDAIPDSEDLFGSERDNTEAAALARVLVAEAFRRAKLTRTEQRELLSGVMDGTEFSDRKARYAAHRKLSHFPR